MSVYIVTSTTMKETENISNDYNTTTFSLLPSSSPTAIGSETLPIKVTKLICYALVFLIGVVGNALVFRMVVRRRKLQTVSNYLICNLAAADIAVLTINLPFRLAYQENAYVWPFGWFLCKIIPMLTYLFITASSATLVVMAVDQHRAVVHPLKKRITITQTKIVIGIVWVVSAIITLPLNFCLQIVYKNGRPVCTDVWPSVLFEQSYFVVLFFLQYLLPMSVITAFYSHVCLNLKQPKLEIGLAQSLLQLREKRNKKVIKMLIVIVAVNAALTLPYHVAWLMSLFGHPQALVKKFCVLLVIATSAAHPIIYGTLNKDFARGFKSYSRYIQCVKCFREQLSSYTETFRKYSNQNSQLVNRSSVSHSSPGLLVSDGKLRKASNVIVPANEVIVVDEYETCV